MNYNAKRLYDATATTYDKRHNNPTTKYMRKKEICMIKKYAKQKTLDIGSGTGEHLKLVSNGIGIDISFSMLKESAKNVSSQLVQAQAEMIPFKEESFDSVLCMFTVLNLCDFSFVVAEINRVLKTNGTAIVSVSSVWDRYDASVFTRMKHTESKRKGMRIEGHRIDFHLFSKKDLIELFENNGFRLLEFHGVFKYQKPYWGWYKNFTVIEKLKLRIFDTILPSSIGRIYVAAFKKIKGNN